jgi:hypothetical protein
MEVNPLSRAKTQCKLAELYWRHAESLEDPTEKTIVLEKAQRCVDQSLEVFTEKDTPRTYFEAKQLRSMILNTLSSIDNKS